MSLAAELAQFSPKKDMLLTIGVFDGVHLGHRQLIARLTELAREQGYSSGVVTFQQHPQEVLSPKTRLPFLTSLDRRIELLKKEGVDEVIALSFTPELANLKPRQFLEKLQEHLRMRGLVIGPDFALGQNRQGDTAALRRLGREMGFSLTVVPPVTIKGQVVSSTTIRKALAEGDVERVQNLIGRPFRLQGKVISGAKRGAGLGFPTANLEISPHQALPAEGVYVSQAHINNHTYAAMTSIGQRPTFGESQRLVESYLLDYQGDLYGKELAVDIIEHLRGEIKFDSPEQLKKQIAKDVKRGTAILKSRGDN
ncbi:MAG TPA: bifunctional riboflavin kinase/FAD synthetase [Dehalococcoidia bacterium]|nr:bifunctional riboflavin kinase/FAD synthetase [Dehalococcoidia bacterium]